MPQSWQKLAPAINQRFIKLAQRKGNLNTPDEITRFLVLAICGEAGELANLLKKQWRGDVANPWDIWNEMADIRIYLEHLAENLGIDLDVICTNKLEQVAQRLDTKEAEHERRDI